MQLDAVFSDNEPPRRAPLGLTTNPDAIVTEVLALVQWFATAHHDFKVATEDGGLDERAAAAWDQREEARSRIIEVVFEAAVGSAVPVVLT